MRSSHDGKFSVVRKKLRMREGEKVCEREIMREKEERKGEKSNPLATEIISVARGIARACVHASERERERRGTRLSSGFSSRQNSFPLRKRDIRGGREKAKKEKKRGVKAREGEREIEERKTFLLPPQRGREGERGKKREKKTARERERKREE